MTWERGYKMSLQNQEDSRQQQIDGARTKAFPLPK